MVYGVTNLQDAIDRGFSLMQYTGFTDRNGKEIYEGDILGGDIVTGYCRVYFGKNEFDERPYAWCIEWTDSKITGFLDVSIRSLKVVGNIYQNPELLREEKQS
jgi:uncharacterized phage protein (TIGR01671 family)